MIIVIKIIIKILTITCTNENENEKTKPAVLMTPRLETVITHFHSIFHPTTTKTITCVCAICISRQYFTTIGPLSPIFYNECQQCNKL